MQPRAKGAQSRCPKVFVFWA